ncbi:hypothetical protein SAMN05216480_102132 [Pustulibacterium marinum]|uniref:Uncharacterized protein n=1 Tax=Pustulibacterium marinum TaxID=1224947 RepID=A0A1I7FQV0_9FLAO|nr:hypothetical protein [Pustulibacterium marinum]SFU38543.1 hypothetical protein SAMN05216480_102132 [Pustulibacterium marinum]
MRDLKVIWDFRGPDAEHTAKHHVIHLKEYASAKDLPFITIDLEVINEHHTIAYIAISEEHTLAIRNELKPHRAVLYK